VARQRDEGVLSALKPKKRGRKEAVRNPLIEENEKLRRDNERLTERLRRAEIIIDVQKKVSQMLGEPLKTTEEGGSD
jgi:regulator of replication initiation timing